MLELGNSAHLLPLYYNLMQVSEDRIYFKLTGKNQNIYNDEDIFLIFKETWKRFYWYLLSLLLIKFPAAVYVDGGMVAQKVMIKPMKKQSFLVVSHS